MGQERSVIVIPMWDRCSFLSARCVQIFEVRWLLNNRLYSLLYITTWSCIRVTRKKIDLYLQCTAFLWLVSSLSFNGASFLRLYKFMCDKVTSAQTRNWTGARVKVVRKFLPSSLRGIYDCCHLLFKCILSLDLNNVCTAQEYTKLIQVYTHT
jgi:hypothetical protein